MKTALLMAATATLFALGSVQASATAITPARGIQVGDLLEHGGGCRKSSPPGQCCHMDNSTGTVHCH